MWSVCSIAVVRGYQLIRCEAVEAPSKMLKMMTFSRVRWRIS